MRKGVGGEKLRKLPPRRHSTRDSDYQIALGDASTTQKKPLMLGDISAIITPSPSARILNTRRGGGSCTTVTIADRCPVCRGYDLDLSHAVFDAIGDQAAGRVTPLRRQLT